MNKFVPARFDERLTLLAIGLEPVDPLRRSRIPHRLKVQVDDFPRKKRRTYLTRHESCVHVLLHREGLAGTRRLRCMDDSRRYVPRRLEVEIAEGVPTLVSPGFFPGAAYDFTPRATGLRGHVQRGGQAMRWVRVEARLAGLTPGSGALVGHAHGDDRGEFLLLLEPAASTIGALADALSVEITLHGPPSPPTPQSPEQPLEDPLWDLPVEPIPGAAPDTASPGRAIPSEYTASSRFVLSLPLGRITSRPNNPFSFP